MSISQRIEKLIQLLLKGTRDGSLEWQITADENSFRLVSAAGNVRVTRSDEFDQEASEPYVARQLCILNDKGRVIEEYAPSVGPERSTFDDLFTLARRSAYKTDQVLEKLMGEISSKIPG